LSLYDNEIDLLETLVEESPGSRLVLRLVKSYRKAGRLSEAASVLERALAANPAKLENRAALAEVLEEMGNSDGALAQLSAVARELSGYAGVYTQLSHLFRARGLGEDADRAEALADALAQPFVSGGSQAARPAGETATMAETKANQGDVIGAAAIYRRLVADHPQDPALAFRLAELEKGTAKPGPMGSVVARLDQLARAAHKRAASS